MAECLTDLSPTAHAAKLGSADEHERLHHQQRLRYCHNQFVELRDSQPEQEERQQSLRDEPAGPFAFMPAYGASSVPRPIGTTNSSAALVHFSGLCFANITLNSWWISYNNMDIVLSAAEPLQGTADGCTEAVQLWSPGLGFKLYQFFVNASSRAGVPQVVHTSWAMAKHGVPLPMSQQYLDRTEGLRALYFTLQPLGMLESGIATALLFLSFIEVPATPLPVSENVRFLHDYVQSDPRMQPKVEPRSAPGAGVARALVPFVDILPGDGLVVLRLDGLDPTLAWTMGFTAAHVAFVMPDPAAPDTQLVVCEANVKSAFWPTNGLQCTPWPTWVDQADAADLNVALAPLNATRAPNQPPLNWTAAWEFVNATLGLQYGFATLLSPWLDTDADNYPCTPPYSPSGSSTSSSGGVCETPVLEELKAVELDKQMGDSVNNVYRQMLHHRLRVLVGDEIAANATTVSDIIATARQHAGVGFPGLAKIPEQDAWNYRLARVAGPGEGEVVDGPSMVCSVFACRVWKAAGVYPADVDFQCGELTPWGVFSAQIFADSVLGDGRPQACRSADPEGHLCQLVGNWTASVPQPDFNSRPVYSNMDETCPSKGPAYERPAGC